MIQKPPHIIYALTITLLSILFTACNLPNRPGSASANEAAAAQTVEAQRTETAAQETPTSDSAENAASGLNDDATFAGDVNFPDYSFIEINVPFTKTWRLQNSGESTWTTSYQLVFDEGDQIGGPSSVPLPHDVPPGESVEISVDLTTPSTPGEYTGFWMLRNAAGELFGVGKDGDKPIFVIINAVNPGQAGGGNQGSIAGGATIIAATIGVDQPNYSGGCPVTLTLSGTITTSTSGTVVYFIDLSATTSGFSFDPSATFSANFNTAGSQNWAFFLTLQDSVNGSANIDVTGANNLISSSTSFQVNCQ